ncbi:hypothetical protein ABR157_005324 [Enterobacter soli]|uniref:hypothetical protein n=1 Tax=unclassified Enterobacter cloacae complex TaxID=2757714 RepID=UPI001EEFB4E0|nr:MULTISPECIES: hypothetical protein [unclassified Enterobacter cloacae complex]UKB52229.1 hypothetical protein L3071_25185 [Enterobacter cloacae complex sp. ECL404]UKB62483.1 hypothetical protein L3069_24915 [Enterobacter cloacae complex sp. ECL411]
MATLKRRLRRRGEGVPDGTAGEAAAVDLSHQTLAIARNPKGFGGDWLVRSSCLAEWGSTTGRRSWPGAEGGHRPAPLFGDGHPGDAGRYRCDLAGNLTRDDLRTVTINANVRIH